MDIGSSWLARITNSFTFLQKFIAVCVIFALTIGFLSFLVVRAERQKLKGINIELEGIQYHRPVMLLLEYIIEHQQTRQRFLMGDRSLDTILTHLENRINSVFNELIKRDAHLEKQLKTFNSSMLSQDSDLNPKAIKEKWEALLKEVDHLDLEKNLAGHLAILEQIRGLAGFIQDSTGLHIDNDLATQHLTRVIYWQLPLLEQRLMELASIGESVAAKGKANDKEQQSLYALIALVETSFKILQDVSWKAIQERKELANDLALKAAIEGPLSELSSTIDNMIEFVKSYLLGREEDATASLSTYIVAATRALNEGFQFEGTSTEQLERILTQRKEKIKQNFIFVATGIFLLTFCAFFFSFVLFRSMFLPLNNLVTAAERLARGDLLARVPIVQSDEIAEVGRAFNHMADAMEEILNQLQSAGVQLTISTTEMAAAAREQEATIIQQETTTKQIAVTAKEISLTANDFAGTIQEVTHSAEEASAMATSGKDALQQMKEIMQNMVDASAEIAAKLVTLNDKTNTITGVITTITKVADRTNLLSLNAAIEAHKLGDKGGGFSVIAAEIRRLADQTAYATLDIEKMVNEMVAAVSSSVEGMVKFSDDIRKGVEQATGISGLLTKIIAQVQQQTSAFEMVNQGMEAQSLGAKQITDSIDELSGVAQQSTSSIRQFHSVLSQLSGAIKDLQNTVSRLKVRA